MVNRSWVEIDLNQLEKNFNLYKNTLSEKQDIIAVVKADAYGHGDMRAAAFLESIGAKHFAVSNVEEAKHLRNAGVTGSILILGYTPSSSFKDLVEYDIIQAVISEEYANEIIEAALPIKAQVAIDTGMNRIGIDADDTDRCIKLIRQYSEKIMINGIFTHLAIADEVEDEGFTNTQIDKFNRIAEGVSDLNLEFVHYMNSAAGLWHNGNDSKFVRLGIVLYGLTPNTERALPEGIKPVLTWKSVISMIKEVNVGECIGYGLTYKAERKMRIATIPTGYADGYNRRLSNKGRVIVRGKSAHIVGRVCMDQMMIDVTDIEDAMCEDEVILIGEGYSADEMASDIGTIGYEVVCGISKRVPRIYK